MPRSSATRVAFPAVSAQSLLRPARPPVTRLADLASRLGLAVPAADAVVTGVTLDSRAVRPGDLYAAVAGSRTHGARFAAAAAAAGASAILTDAAGAGWAADAGLPLLEVPDPRAVLGRVAATVYGDPSSRLRVLGVTGTNGKTTTAYLLEAGLRAAGHRTGLVGTVETRIAGTAVPSVRTTPEAPDLQAAFAAMAEQSVTAVAMEVSSHALALGRVDGTRFAAGAFTNLSQDHLDFHPDMEAYFGAKALLFDGRCEHEIVNVDDPYGRRLVRTGRTVTVSASGRAADWRAGQLRATPAGATSFRLAGPDGVEVAASVPMPGAFNVANALLAIATLAAVGIEPADAVTGVAGVAVPGRMEPVSAGQDFLAMVDYAHTPEAVTRLLAAVREAVTGRVLTVLGCGGDRDRGKRPLMGQAAATGSDLLVVTDDNPRSEPPATIRAAMLAGALAVPASQRGAVVEVAGRPAAIAEAVLRARPGDAVVVAGRGHEQGQEVAGTVYPLDDRVVLREAIERRLVAAP